MISMPRTLLLSASILCALPTPGSAQALPEEFAEPMPIYQSALGPFGREIKTESAQAQAYFDQGIQFIYAFTPMDAARSFREAQKADPGCAMCFWGEAWSWGPYMNGPLRAENSPRAYAAIQRAMELMEGSAPVEQALIQAMATRFVEVHDPDTRRDLDTRYSNAMKRVYAEFPRDLDSGTLYGESLMLLEPRRGNWDVERGEIQLIHQVLEDVLSKDIRHPGACHLFIHATESTTVPGKAEACANYLGNAIPGASHINHMPSHTYNRIGRWADAVTANVQAWHSDQKAAIGEGFAIYPSHNLHMLLFAGSMAGQGAISIQAGKDYGKLVDGGAFYHALTLVRFGRFDEVLELNDPPENPIFRGLWEFSRGYAHLRTGNETEARASLSRVQEAAATTPDSLLFRGHSTAQLLGVVGGILQGELQREGGNLAGAITTLEEAVRIEDGLRYDEPEPLNFSARHWLGAALVEAGRHADAEVVYRLALEDHPQNGWSLYGLEQALRGQGKTTEADQVHEMFVTAWERADIWIRSSRY